MTWIIAPLPGTALTMMSSSGASLCMHVIKLDKIELTYFNHHTGYPYVGSPVSIRAVVWFTCTGDGGPRCDLSFDPELEWWWAAGSEGPQTDGIPPPVTPVFQAAGRGGGLAGLPAAPYHRVEGTQAQGLRRPGPGLRLRPQILVRRVSAPHQLVGGRQLYIRHSGRTQVAGNGHSAPGRAVGEERGLARQRTGPSHLHKGPGDLRRA